MRQNIPHHMRQNMPNTNNSNINKNVNNTHKLNFQEILLDT